MLMTDHAVMDTAIASGLVTSPVWGPSLAEVNMLLSMATLAIGLILGIARLTAFLLERRRQRLPDMSQDRGDQVSKS
jgi:hypothetical protein